MCELQDEFDSAFSNVIEHLASWAPVALPLAWPWLLLQS